MKRLFRWTLALALAATTALPAAAATLSITFVDYDNHIRGLGSFTAPDTGGAVTNFSVSIGSTLYSAVYFSAADFAPQFNASAVPLHITTTDQGWTYFSTGPNDGAVRPVLYIDHSRRWALGSCQGVDCHTTLVGDYTISAVPCPQACRSWRAGSRRLA